MDYKIGLLGNIVIKGTIIAKTGLHIGAAADSVEIGGIDSPVIKHPVTGAPYIPGSSLKGKMRSFLEKISVGKNSSFRFNRSSGPSKNLIWQHVCDDINFSYSKADGNGAKKCPVCRVYGSTGQNDGKNYPSRIVVRDCYLVNKEKIMDDQLYVFEAKMENAIDRITANASPRTFERVPEGAEFNFEIVYKVQGEFENGESYKLKQEEIIRMQEDMRNIFEVLYLVTLDGLGGSVSRGYGKVHFSINPDESLYYPIGKDAKSFLPSLDVGSSKDEEKEKKEHAYLDDLRVHGFANLESIVLGE